MILTEYTLNPPSCGTWDGYAYDTNHSCCYYNHFLFTFIIECEYVVKINTTNIQNIDNKGFMYYYGDTEYFFNFDYYPEYKKLVNEIVRSFGLNVMLRHDEWNTITKSISIYDDTNQYKLYGPDRKNIYILKINENYSYQFPNISLIYLYFSALYQLKI